MLNHPHKAILLACLASTLCGCSGATRWWHNGLKVGPNYCRPVVPMAMDWIDSDDKSVVQQTAQQTAEFHDWWTVFDDPTLDQLIQTAYQQNLPLRTAGLRVLEARAQRRITAGNLFPQTQRLFGQHTRNQQSQTTAIVGGPRNFDDWQTGFDLSWEIDVWGRLRRAIESSDAAIDAEIEGYDDILVTLIGDVAAGYINLRALDERIRLAQANVASQQGSLEITQVRYKEGDVSELDTQQATANLTSTRALIPALRQSRRQALNGLAILLGMTPYDLEPILQAAGKIPDAPDQVVVGIPAELLRRRPDIRQAERQIAQQSAQIGIAEADLYPQFAINGEIKLQSAGFGNLFDSSSVAGAVTPGFRWKILNYGRLRNNIRVQELRFQQQITTYENTVLQAQREVEDAMAQFLRSKEQTEQLQQSVNATKRSVELVRIQYKEGETEFNQVFVLESNLVSAQDQLVVAQANIAIGLTKVYKALGGGWQLRTTTPYSGAYPLVAIGPVAPEGPGLFGNQEGLEELPLFPIAPLEFGVGSENE